MYYCPFYCYIRSPLKFSELNQQPCYSVHELYGSGKGTGQDSLSLLHDVWGAQTTGWLTHLGPDCPRGAIVHLSGILAGGGKDGLHLAASSRSLFWVSKLIPGWAAPLWVADGPSGPGLRVMQSLLPHSIGYEQVIGQTRPTTRGSRALPFAQGVAARSACTGAYWMQDVGAASLEINLPRLSEKHVPLPLSFAKPFLPSQISSLMKMFPDFSRKHPRMSAGPVREHRRSGKSTGSTVSGRGFTAPNFLEPQSYH